MWPLEATDTLIHWNLLQEGEALSLREVWGLHLAKVELNGTVVADDVGEQSLIIQSVLTNFESNFRLLAVLGE